MQVNANAVGFHSRARQDDNPLGPSTPSAFPVYGSMLGMADCMGERATVGCWSQQHSNKAAAATQLLAKFSAHHTRVKAGVTHGRAPTFSDGGSGSSKSLNSRCTFSPVRFTMLSKVSASVFGSRSSLTDLALQQTAAHWR